MSDKGAILKKAGIPIPDGEILELRFLAYWGDWYARTDAGWFWYDARGKAGMGSWKPCPNGPIW